MVAAGVIAVRTISLIDGASRLQQALLCFGWFCKENVPILDIMWIISNQWPLERCLPSQRRGRKSTRSPCRKYTIALNQTDIYQVSPQDKYERNCRFSSTIMRARAHYCAGKSAVTLILILWRYLVNVSLIQGYCVFSTRAPCGFSTTPLRWETSLKRPLIRYNPHNIQDWYVLLTESAKTK